MTSKKSKGSKSDSRTKKRSQTTSSSSSTPNDERKGPLPDVVSNETQQRISTDEITAEAEVVDDTTIIEPISDSMVFSDEPTLTELIIERYIGEKVNGRFEGLGAAVFVNGNVYEGMFSEGTMHGTGKFYWTSENITYEGDFYHNEITGKGKYIWPNGSSYEGEVLHGIRYGQGTYLHLSGQMYSGTWLNGVRQGFGLLHYDREGRSFYEGEWKANVIDGIGFRRYKSGNTYEGEWYKGKRHGNGMMKWLDRNEQYSGQWKEGIQSGYGQHIWFVQRIKGSQYSMRNVYEGEFLNGKRNGYGTFIYPSGARYEGQWVDNKKCGRGDFVFKNGKVYEGEFENDKMKEFPDVSLTGRDTPDLIMSKVHCLMQNDIENLSARLSVCSENTTSPSFKLYLDHLLVDPMITNPDEELIQINKAVLRHLKEIRKIYQHYSSLGMITFDDNTSVMNQMQLWRFLKDSQLHADQGPTLADLDRVLATSNGASDPENIHNPTSRIILLSFVNYLISVAFFIHGDNYKDEENNGHILEKCFEDLFKLNILPNACSVGGLFFIDPRRTEVLVTHFNPLYLVYKDFCNKRQAEPYDFSMRMRDFLIMMKKLDLLNENLTSAEIVRIFSLDDPNVTDGQFVDMEREITFYDFFETMISCATSFITRDIVNSHLHPEGKKPSSVNMTGSENIDDSETDIALTLSRPLTTESNLHEIDGDDKVNARSSGKSPSGKTKLSSTDSANAKGRKTELDKATKRTPKSTKSPKVANPRSRKMSVDKNSPNPQKAPSVVENTNAQVTDETPEVNSTRKMSEIPVIPEINEEQEFNFWTIQIYIFFCNYLFPAAEKFLNVKRKIEEKQSLETDDLSNNTIDFNVINTDFIDDTLINENDALIA